MFDIAAFGPGPDECSCRDAKADRRGDARRAVEAALVETMPVYSRLAIKRLRSAGEAEDVVQSYALRALERVDQLRDLAAVHGWLRRIFETQLLDHCRRHSRRAACEVAFDPALHDSAVQADAAWSGDPAEEVARFLPGIKPQYADLIRRLDLHNEDRFKTASELGISVNNLTVRLHRARATLRQRIESAPGELTPLAFAA